MNLSDPLLPPGHMPVQSAHALEPGAMLEDFEIIQVLGLAGFGVLYLAAHVTEGHTVAIKEYLPSAIALRGMQGTVELLDPAHEESFQRGLQAFASEALTLSQFDHPNLLKVSCVWEGNGTIYRAMPYIVGSTLLTQRSNSQEPASQAQLQSLLDGLLAALQVLSDAGLAHGQVEPINILMPQGGLPVLMDFNAVHHAVLSDLTLPHVDAYADPSRVQQTLVDDLHAVAAVLHFAISAHWAAPSSGAASSYEPLADVLARLKDSASALGYDPDFLTAIDTALALPPNARPRTVDELRALFDGTPPPVKVEAVALPAPAVKTPRPRKNPLPERPKNEFPLNSSESVLALLANFDRGARREIDDIEPFEAPSVPTLTEEAEPALPPLRESLFDAIEAGDPVPQGVGYSRVDYTPMPRIRPNPWRRIKLIAGMATLALACLGTLAWQLFG
jgi:serine/threonine protein kinase